MTITNFRIPEKHKNKSGQKLTPQKPADRRNGDLKGAGWDISDRELDEMLRDEFLENARALEEEAMAVTLDIPKEQQDADAQAMLDRMLAMIHEDPELDALAKQPVGAKMADRAEDMEELIRLGRALKESGKTLEDVTGGRERKSYFGRRARLFAGLAASLVIVFTVSMNGSAMRTFLIERLGWTIGENPATTIDTDSELHFSEDRDFSEVEALEVIKNDLGIAPIIFEQKPNGMKYDDVYVDSNAMWAKLFYLYNDMVVTVIMDKSNEDMSAAIVYDGEKIEEQIVELPVYATEVKVEKIQRDKEHTAFYAELEYGNAFYTVKGDMEEDVFLELIQNITFG